MLIDECIPTPLFDRAVQSSLDRGRPEYTLQLWVVCCTCQHASKHKIFRKLLASSASSCPALFCASTAPPTLCSSRCSPKASPSETSTPDLSTLVFVHGGQDAFELWVRGALRPWRTLSPTRCLSASIERHLSHPSAPGTQLTVGSICSVP